MDIGFIGLGTMGSRVCENLIKAVNQVRVALRRAGLEEASRVRETPSPAGELRA
jgi:3-hydroxyisobutyrate dehydrogenase-like beta-hydroxyacid dehydrogenase